MPLISSFLLERYVNTTRYNVCLEKNDLFPELAGQDKIKHEIKRNYKKFINENPREADVIWYEDSSWVRRA